MAVEGAGASGAANDARVQIGTTPEDLQAERERLADEAEAQVGVIEEKLAGVKEALTAKKAEAKQLRAEARKGAKG